MNIGRKNDSTEYENVGSYDKWKCNVKNERNRLFLVKKIKTIHKAQYLSDVGAHCQQHVILRSFGSSGNCNYISGGGGGGGIKNIHFNK